MAQANYWVINVREIAAADGKTIGTKYGSPPSIHLSYPIFSSSKSTFSMTLVLVVLALLWKQWVIIMAKSFPVAHDRRQKTGWRRRIVTKEDLAAEESRHRQRPGWAPVLGPYLSRIPLQRSSMFTMCNDSPCLSRTPLQRSSIFINCNNVSLGVNFGSLLNVTILFWLLKNEELVKDFLHLPLSFFSHISLPLKVECWLLEDGKNVEVQNFSGL